MKTLRRMDQIRAKMRSNVGATEAYDMEIFDESYKCRNYGASCLG